MNPKGNYFLDNRKPLSKPSQDPLSFVMVSPQIKQIDKKKRKKQQQLLVPSE